MPGQTELFLPFPEFKFQVPKLLQEGELGNFINRTAYIQGRARNFSKSQSLYLREKIYTSYFFKFPYFFIFLAYMCSYFLHTSSHFLHISFIFFILPSCFLIFLHNSLLFLRIYIEMRKISKFSNFFQSPIDRKGEGGRRAIRESRIYPWIKIFRRAP